MLKRSGGRQSLEIKMSLAGELEEILPAPLIKVLTDLHRRLEPSRSELLESRHERQARYDQGATPVYLEGHPATFQDWKVRAIPKDLLDRRVEITGPVNNTKMVINMLSPNAEGVRAQMAMLDFEDSMKPTWENVVSGIRNVVAVAKQNLRYVQPESGKVYELDPSNMAHPMVRVRGLHLTETNVWIDGTPISASLFDLAVCAYHTAAAFLNQGLTPKYYVPKCESYLEARWWNQLFSLVEGALDFPVGTLRCTLLIETLPAAFQMEEILYEMRDHAVGLNGGRWDKIFSDIKVLRNHPDRIMADRASIDMSRPWMDNYAKRLIKICHLHGAFAMGGMAAFTPGQDPALRELQTERVRADKLREATIGHDGCWVSHPYFIGVALSQFPDPNQLGKQLADFPLRPELLPRPTGPKTIEGLRTNIRVGIAYLHGWNQGFGCVAFQNLMEDLATLEISRAQTWQWLHHNVVLDDGTPVTQELVVRIFDEECAKILNELSEVMEDLNSFKQQCSDYLAAAEEANRLFLEKDLRDFFTEKKGRTYAIAREGTRIQMEPRSTLEGHQT